MDPALAKLKSWGPNPVTDVILEQGLVAPGIAYEIAEDSLGGMDGKGLWGLTVVTVEGHAWDSCMSAKSEDEVYGYLETLKENPQEILDALILPG